MKISILALASLAAPAMADFNLRSKLNQMLTTSSTTSSDKTESLDARITVGGITSAMSKEEAKFVSQQAMAAFNRQGLKLANIEARGSAQLKKQDTALVRAVVELLSYEGSVTADGLVEKDLCDRLRSSGYETFSNAKDCSFAIVAEPGAAKAISLQSTYPAGNTKTVEAQLKLVGLPNAKLSKAEGQFLDKVVLEGHKKAFGGKSGVALASFETQMGVAVEGHHSDWLNQCIYCCDWPDDDVYNCPASFDAVTLVMATAVPVGVPSTTSTPTDAKMSHHAFETYVCSKLRNSGMPTFANVHDCAFEFVYSP